MFYICGMVIYTVITFYENGVDICTKYVKSFTEYNDAEQYSLTHLPNCEIVVNILENKQSQNETL
jgi:hypothetical protein